MSNFVYCHSYLGASQDRGFRETSVAEHLSVLKLYFQRIALAALISIISCSWSGVLETSVKSSISVGLPTLISQELLNWIYLILRQGHWYRSDDRTPPCLMPLWMAKGVDWYEFIETIILIFLYAFDTKYMYSGFTAKRFSSCNKPACHTVSKTVRMSKNATKTLSTFSKVLYVDSCISIRPHLLPISLLLYIWKQWLFHVQLVF